MKVKKNLNRDIFREYDIRGDSSLIDDDTAYTIGLGYGSKLLEINKSVCLVGHDNRLSSERITNALLKGITDSGVDVVYIGLTTTPMQNFAMINLNIESGIMVTASHNPKNDNGFKFSFANFKNVFGQKIRDFYKFLLEGKFQKGNGTISYTNVKEKYIQTLLKDINIKKRLKVIVDCANGTTSILARDVFDRLDIDVDYLYDVSDGNFKNHHPDPFEKENMMPLEDYVKTFKYDLGIAFDGDGDRVGFVDNQGRIIDIDKFMALMCRSIIPNSDNKTILYDVKCSNTLRDEIEKLGGTPFMYRTGGNTYVKSKVKEMNLDFGGELSGHVIFRDKYIGIDDGIYAGIRFIEFLSNEDKSSSKLVDSLNKYYSTPEIRIESSDQTKFSCINNIKHEIDKEKDIKISTIDGLRVDYKDSWALVRASNTGPKLTARFEASSKEKLEEIKNKYLKLIEKYNKEIV